MTKKRILIFPFDLMSHYLRCITLAKQYADSEVLFAYSEKYNSFVKKAGFKSFNVEAFDAEEVLKCAEKFNFKWLNRASLEKVMLSQIKTINELKPDIVIGDTAPTLKMAAEITKTKYIALMNGYMSKYYNEVRHVSVKHYSYLFISWLPTVIKKIITRFAEKMSFKIIHASFKVIRKKYGLLVIKDYLAELEGDENLICDETWLFPQKKLPDSYKIIGALRYQSDANDYDLLASIDLKKPTIAVCLGSSGNWRALQFLSSEFFSSVNIITAGDLKQIIKGNHVYQRNFVNLSQILPGCAFMICQGGNGTIYEGLKHKVYMLCLTSHFEQEWNVQRLSKLNLAILINKDPAFYITKKIKEVLNATK